MVYVPRTTAIQSPTQALHTCKRDFSFTSFNPSRLEADKKKREEIITLKTHECTIIIEAAFTVKSRFLLYSLTKSKKKN